jgi:hypothetical protein
MSDRKPPYGQRVLVRDVLTRIGVLDRTDKQGDLFLVEGEPTEDADRRDIQYWMPLPQ